MNQWAGITPEERFWPKVRMSDDCWEWAASHDTRGYGLLWLNRRWIGAHRFSYELHVGPIPDGLELDHLCGNKGCVNPDHLEPVTHLENMRRVDFSTKRWSGIGHARRTHCPSGHPYDFIDSNGSRSCRTCRREANRRYRANRHPALAKTAGFLR